MKWLPIDTAPKDGTLILGCIKPPPQGEGFSGGWVHQYEQWLAPITISYRGFHPNMEGKKQWRDARGNPYSATHWMPLPEPPEVAE